MPFSQSVKLQIILLKGTVSHILLQRWVWIFQYFEIFCSVLPLCSKKKINILVTMPISSNQVRKLLNEQTATRSCGNVGRTEGTAYSENRQEVSRITKLLNASLKNNTIKSICLFIIKYVQYTIHFVFCTMIQVLHMIQELRNRITNAVQCCMVKTMLTK